MQQYFINQQLRVKESVRLDDDVLYHLIKVLRKDASYTFRLCDINGIIYHAHLIDKQNAVVVEKLAENNELDCEITCVLSLIKNDHFELCLQKLTELGVSRIVPFEARRSVMKIRGENKLERYRKIIREAAEQSHRNFIPELTDPIRIDKLHNYKSEANYICYESEKQISDIAKSPSITYIIGPEGGFEAAEYEEIRNLGFESISLGKRILRAETAALYMSSVIISKCQ